MQNGTEKLHKIIEKELGIVLLDVTLLSARDLNNVGFEINKEASNFNAQTHVSNIREILDIYRSVLESWGSRYQHRFKSYQ